MDTHAEFIGSLRVTVESVPDVPQIRGVVTWTFDANGITVRGENLKVDTLTAGKTATANVEWTDDQGNAAKVDGITKWASSDEDILTVEDINTGDSTSARVISVGPIGPAQIQATADADMGAGVKTITCMIDVTVIAGEASGGKITLTPDLKRDRG